MTQQPTCATCINHPERKAMIVLDMEPLCSGCADAWVKAEGAWQQYLDDEDRGEHTPKERTEP